MRVLHLTLKKQWFDMVVSRVKPEEYREIKPYWDNRLNKQYDAVLFRNGYATNAPEVLIELKEITTGFGRLFWGAPIGQKVYILKLGKFIKEPLNAH